MIIIVGDVHWKEEPYNLGLEKLFEFWIAEYGNKNNTFIFTGDFFDTTRPRWDIYDKACEKLEDLKSQVHIVEGNHDKYFNVGSAVFPLKRLGFHVHQKPTELTIEGIPFLFLPYDSHASMLEYENYSFTNGKVVTHIAPPGSNWGKGEYDLKNIENCEIFHGHIHTFDFNRRVWNNNVEHIIGVPQTTRQGEEGMNKYFATITDGVTDFVECPRYFDIVDIDYNTEELPEDSINLYRVFNAPSKNMVFEKFNNIYVKKDEIQILNQVIDIKKLDEIRLNNKNGLSSIVIDWGKERDPDQEIFDLIYSKVELVNAS